MRAFVFFSLILFGRGVMSQTYFSVVPDFGGDWGAGIIYNVIPLEENIKIIGLLHDSIVPGLEGGDWPILGTISYYGQYSNTKYLIDTLYADGFRYITRPIRFKNDSIITLYDRRSLNQGFLRSYLCEINLHTGQIIRSKIIYDETKGQEPFMPRTFNMADNGTVYLINVIDLPGDYSQVLTVLDSNWNIIRQSRIDSNNGRFFANYIDIQPNNDLYIVGINLGDDTPVWWESKLYYQMLDSTGVSKSLAFAESKVGHSIVLADAYPVLKSKAGEWVIASQEVVETYDCQGCSVYIPYVVCLSSDFSVLKWETRMHDGDVNSSIPYQVVSSMTEVSDGFIFVARRNGILGPETGALLGKVGLNGDSLWTRRYIPSGWSDDQALWFNMKDIKTTPYGDIVVGGYGRDRFNELTVPWIMHLDKDGCLEPGCLNTSVSPEGKKLPLGLQVHPNPASDQIYIHIKAESVADAPYQLQVFSPDGKLMHAADIEYPDAYYMLDVRSWLSGVYTVSVSDANQHTAYKQMVVKSF